MILYLLLGGFADNHIIKNDYPQLFLKNLAGKSYK
ncbi:hypothetical protein PSM36_2217 [Proteiniphilum saccharofermentans]|uniref:Uncharacterized protein n=1 Tax=Proteiniphilum saccharofermentans TaxID=1642647 RepID=A0A1R3T4E1_9BACT|nr:hypothetical protein PSM36_2217 [Proteiniphilum saccharofermentans]